LPLQLKQLKQSVIKTQHSQEFQKSLTSDYPALVCSLLRAHSPLCRLLNYVVY